ncbi:MAG: G/U mismatch-specific DNA glycosylase [Acidimicrobiales bacterium]
MTTPRPSPAALEAAKDRYVPDLVRPDLSVLFCGINPGLWSGAVGHHFARPGNRFWKVLHAAGFTPEILDPANERSLLDLGIGITNLVPRTTAAASELTAEELRQGTKRLERVVRRVRPGWVAFLGMGAYRTAFARSKEVLGEQPERLGPAGIWLLPNPSGLQARYQLAELTTLFSQLRAAVENFKSA